MRKVIISLATAASALAVATPAAAQYYPAPPYAPVPQAYNQQGYNPQAYNPNGYNPYNSNSNSITFGRTLQGRIDQIQREIDVLAARRAISQAERNGLVSESRSLETRLRNTARWGLDARERYDVEVRIARLEQHVRHEVNDGNRGRGSAYGYNPNGYNPNGYNQYGYNQYNPYGATDNLTFGTTLQARLVQIQREISALASRRAISRTEYNGLIAQSRSLETRLGNKARWGLDASERNDIQVRLVQLEQHVRREVRDGNGRPGNSYGSGNSFPDRDRDGRDDRTEDDRGTRRD